MNDEIVLNFDIADIITGDNFIVNIIGWISIKNSKTTPNINKLVKEPILRYCTNKNLEEILPIISNNDKDLLETITSIMKENNIKIDNFKITSINSSKIKSKKKLINMIDPKLEVTQKKSKIKRIFRR